MPECMFSACRAKCKRGIPICVKHFKSMGKAYQVKMLSAYTRYVVGAITLDESLAVVSECVDEVEAGLFFGHEGHRKAY